MLTPLTDVAILNEVKDLLLRDLLHEALANSSVTSDSPQLERFTPVGTTARIRFAVFHQEKPRFAILTESRPEVKMLSVFSFALRIGENIRE